MNVKTNENTNVNMNKLVKNHPIFNSAVDIVDICKPLEQLGITYFSHVNIDTKGNFTGIGKNPEFAHHYLKNQYYNADIHLANEILGDHIVWDALDITGESEKMNQEAGELGVRHTFTIVTDNQPNIATGEGKNFYHFSTDKFDPTINQVYLSNLDLLKTFIQYFNEQVIHSKVLKSAYDFKFHINEENGEFQFSDESKFRENFNISHSIKRDLELILSENKKINQEDAEQNGIIIVDRKNNLPITLAPQQLKCLSLLLKGYTSKEIARLTSLSYRTVEHYIEKIKKILGCRSSKELIASFNIYLQNCS